MHRFRAIAVLAALAIVLASSPALAKQGEHESRRKLQGVITAVADGSITVGDTVVPLTDATRYSSPHHLVAEATDLREGDWVRVDRRGTAAKRVQLKLIALEGVATAVSADSLSLDVAEANKPGTAFLGDATSATVALTDDTHVDDEVAPAVGDAVEVQARVTATNATALEAIAVEVVTPEPAEPVAG